MMPKCPFCGPTHELNKELSKENADLRTLLRETLTEWGCCTRSNDPYNINRYQNFLNRPEVKAVMEEKP